MALQRITKIGLALTGGLALIAALAWMQREPLARTVIDQQLAESDVKASYRFDGLGTSRQRLVDVRIGDPAHPDLVADWAEVETVWSFWGPRISTIKAGGVMLNARMIDGKLSFGALDKLLPADDGTPFSLPPLTVDLYKARARIETPQGIIGVALSGRGPLDNGFEGQIAAAAPSAVVGGCQIDRARLQGRISTKGGQPVFSGPASINAVSCAKGRINAVNSDLDISSNSSFNLFNFNGKIKSGIVRSGDAAVQSFSSEFSLKGAVEALEGSAQLQLTGLSVPQGQVGGAALRGPIKVGWRKEGLFLEAGGTVAAQAVTPARGIADDLARLGSSLSASPVDPLMKELVNAVRGLDRGSSLTARYDLRHEGNEGTLSLSGVKAASASGLRLAMAGEAPLRISWPQSGLHLSGTAELQGGGFPDVSARFNGAPGTISGTAVMTPWQSGSARLALTPMRFNWADGAYAFETRATLDGPLAQGRVQGLSLPLALRSGAPALAGCHQPSFMALTLDGLRLGPTRIAACVRGNEVVFTAPRLVGRLGQSPLLISAQNARLQLGTSAFQLSGLSARLGDVEAVSHVMMDRLSGRLNGGAASGQFAGLSGKIGAVPVRMDQGTGQWRFSNGNMSANGALSISDAAAEERYHPFVSPDFSLSIRDGQVNASGTLRNPKRQVDVAQIFIRHSLSRGAGQAEISMPGLTFGQAIQPEEITPITNGVIALVDGTLKGHGIISWSDSGVSSSGSFGTDRMDMAAAFGPVSGLSGQISFSDLLGLETLPGQQVRIMTINPGVAVTDGQVMFRLLPGLKAQIEGGRWPFAGGFLVLEPTILDLNTAAERRLTFRVEGLDAARFIAAMEFENIAATGTFDGELPMVFDAQGGRIEGGTLVARSGGTLSYVGEISNENLGMMGRFAFDALKSLRYNRLAIDLDGAIDGDVVTRIRFAGVNQAPISGVRATLPIPIKVTGLTNIPFIFNVTITAKFRELFEMARSFNDPSVLINRAIPKLEPVPNQPARPVQPPERPKLP